ncbi:MAG: response regulator [Pseudomonadota bacterium]
MRALIVEDDLLLAEYYQVCLESQGYECALVRTVDDARVVIEADRFNLYVFNLFLLGKSTGPLTWKVRYQNRGATIIMVTGADFFPVEGKTKHFTADYIFRKPVDGHDLGALAASKAREHAEKLEAEQGGGPTREPLTREEQRFEEDTVPTSKRSKGG